MNYIKEFIIPIILILILVIIGNFISTSISSKSFGEAAVFRLEGSGTSSEKSISATNDTKILSANGGRQYLEICKVSALSTSNITFSLSVNASASQDSGIQINNNRPCFVSNDLNLITGGVWALASPSAASLSYFEY